MCLDIGYLFIECVSVGSVRLVTRTPAAVSDAVVQ
jgi:hypothetical protein